MIAAAASMEPRQLRDTFAAVTVVGLWLRFVLGMVIGACVTPLIMVWAFIGKRRPIHFDGAVCRATITAIDHGAGQGPGRRLAGKAIVRLSGGGKPENSTAADVMGLALRLQDGDGSTDLTNGTQDLIFGTFESFLSVAVTVGKVKVGDYLANQYASVTPWRVKDLGVVHLRAMPPRDSVGTGADRVARLLADIAAGTAVFTLEARRGDERIALATLTLDEHLPAVGKALRMSMWRNGRKFHPTGTRNGIRAVVYPFSQLARGLRGG